MVILVMTTDPGLWLAFGVTVALSFLVIVPIARRQSGGRRAPRHGR
jgi:hypothetical protein